MYEAYQKFKTHLLPTPTDIEGPLYKTGAPEIWEGILATPDQFNRQILYIAGKVQDTNGTPIVGAILDVWQADSHGVYDNDTYKLRGKIKAGADGAYKLETIMPGDYQIADNPPDFRCAHIHFKVSAPGYKLLTTQLYFKDTPYDDTDHWFDLRRCIQFSGNDKVNGTFDFVLEKL
jgi:protocatechuate 3,4-dioxygenase beta subunit